VRIDGRRHWELAFQNDQVVIRVVRDSRASSVVSAVMAGHRPGIRVSDLYGAQQGHADLWRVCLAHQLRGCQFGNDAGDTIFAPRMKALARRAVVLAPGNRHARRLRKCYGKVRNSLFTFLAHPDVPPDNNGSERQSRPPATYRKVKAGFRSNCCAGLFAAVRSAVGTATRRG